MKCGGNRGSPSKAKENRGLSKKIGKIEVFKRKKERQKERKHG